jgi:hypothetical protein
VIGNQKPANLFFQTRSMPLKTRDIDMLRYLASPPTFCEITTSPSGPTLDCSSRSRLDVISDRVCCWEMFSKVPYLSAAVKTWRLGIRPNTDFPLPLLKTIAERVRSVHYAPDGLLFHLAAWQMRYGFDNGTSRRTGTEYFS